MEKKKLESKVKFDKKTAKRLMDTSYYEAQSRDMKLYEHLQEEKARLATQRTDRITKILQYYKDLGETSTSGTGRVLLGLYNKNKQAVLNKTPVVNSKLLSIVAKPETILLAYREIRGNKGALTPGSEKTSEEVKNMTSEQLEVYEKSNIFPDGFSIEHVYKTCKLLRQGKYPWGSSSRIYIPKPGFPDKQRPITIPPFMDRVVQKAIELVLQSIYEPEFEVVNRSFGFRPNKGVHDAMTAIKSKKTGGMRVAIEGDVEAAYDTVDKEILINILKKKISDQKFINLIRERLKYEYVEKETGKRNRPELGIPQGGIDSPYLFNIYMHELDVYVQNELKEYVETINNEKLGDKSIRGQRVRVVSKQYNAIRKIIYAIKGRMKAIKKELKTLDKENTESLRKLRMELFAGIKNIKKLHHQSNRIRSGEPTMREINIFYVRYADDWVLITNGTKEIAINLKEKIEEFLKTRLKLKLSETKTLITDVTKTPAKFLGFEIRVPARGPLYKKAVTKTSMTKKKSNVQRKAGLPLWLAPDRQRLISRLHMKGFCKKDGTPKEIPWLSTLEPHVIIQRYNAVIRGIANFYIGYIRNTSLIFRWIYILRYSCYKTFAQKYNTSISKIIKRFGIGRSNRTFSTITVKVKLKVKEEEYSKEYTLLTYNELKKAQSKDNRPKKLENRFWDIELRKQIGDYPIGSGRIAKVTNENYLDAISWVSFRTQAAFDMPCAICGSSQLVEMHHIRHVRKRSYTLIPDNLDFEKVMALRNRKQIPICQSCHRKVVHGGEYADQKLSSLAPRTTLVDNRIVHVESFVKPGVEYHGKTLVEKGWERIVPKKD